LLERLKFATIVTGNLDEFFMVRVASLKNAVAEGDKGVDAAGLTPSQQLALIAERAHAMVDRLYGTLNDEILPGLTQRGVRIVPVAALEPAPRAALSRYFRDEILPALTPLAIDSSRPFPMLANLTLNLAVVLDPADDGEKPRLGGGQVPARLSRAGPAAGGA